MDPYIDEIMGLSEALAKTLPEFAGLVAVNVPNEDDNAVRAVVAHVRLTSMLVALVAQWLDVASEAGDQAAAEYLGDDEEDDDEVEEGKLAVDSVRADVAVICDRLEEFAGRLPLGPAEDWPNVRRGIAQLRGALDGLRG